MAIREIKTTIALDGEAEFKRALADANREMRLMGAELKELASEFEGTGDQQTYYARRSKTLSREMQQQENIVSALERAVQDMAKKHGDASRQVQDMNIQLTNARTKLNRIQKEFNDNEKASRDFGKSLDKNVEKEAEQAGKAVTELKTDLSGLEKELGGIRGGLGELQEFGGFDFAAELFDGAMGLMQNVLDWGAEGREWRRGEAATKYAAERSGISEETVRVEIMDIATVTGQREEAQTGTRMLMNIEGITEDMLRTINDNLLGASLLFPELGYGQLAEGFQESASSGTLTGPFLELLERSGYQQGRIDQINEQLQKEPTQYGRAGILLSALTEATPEGGMSFVEFLAHYMTNEKTLIDSERAQQIADEAWGKAMASESVQKFSQIGNSWKMVGAGLLTNDFSGLMNYTREIAKDGINYWNTHEPQNWYEWRLFENLQAPPEGYDPEKVGKAPWLYWGGKPVWIREERTDWGEPMGEFQSRMLAEKMTAEKPTLTPAQTYAPTTGDAEELKTATSQMLQNALEGARETLGDLPEKLGIDIGDDLGAGITESGGRAVASMREVVDALNSEMNRIAVPQVTFPTMASAAGSAGAGRNSAGSIFLDGHKVGSVLLPAINKGLGRNV